MSGPLLSVRNLTKRFGGVIAINDLTFDVKENEILGLIGPNGAGKTTLFHLISGFEEPDSGIIKFKEKVINGLGPHEIVKLGISRTFQIPQPFLNLTVFQNLLVAAMYGAGLRKEKACEEAKRILDVIELTDKGDWLARDLTMSDLRRLELARALCNKPCLLLVDEVAAGLSYDEIPKLLNVLRKVHDMGVTIIVVEHVLSVIMKIANRVIVLHEGKKLAEGKPEEIAHNEKVMEAYFGTRFVKYSA